MTLSALEPSRTACRSYHDWLVPMVVLQVTLVVTLTFLTLGLILLAVGGGVGVNRLFIIGGIFVGIGACGLIVSLVLCVHAYFVINVRDGGVQTSANTSDENVTDYAALNKKPTFDTVDQFRNDTHDGSSTQVKKVRIAPSAFQETNVYTPLHKETPTIRRDKELMSHLPKPTNKDITTSNWYNLSGRSATNLQWTPVLADAKGFDKSFYGEKSTTELSARESSDMKSVQQQQQQKIDQCQSTHLHEHNRLKNQQTMQGHEDWDIEIQRQQLELQRQNLQRQRTPRRNQRDNRPQEPQLLSHQSGLCTRHFISNEYPDRSRLCPSPYISSHESLFSGGNTAKTTNIQINKINGKNYQDVLLMQSTIPEWKVYADRSTTPLQNYYNIQMQNQQNKGYPTRDDDYDDAVERSPAVQDHTGYRVSTSNNSNVLVTNGGEKGVRFGTVVRNEIYVPEPAPLQYPSEIRPINFEMQSSSKMSVYDNVLFPLSDS